MFDLI